MYVLIIGEEIFIQFYQVAAGSEYILYTLHIFQNKAW